MPDPTAGSTPSREPSELIALKVVDAATYAVAMLAAVAVPVALVELTAPAFGGLIFTKWVLFFVGSLLAAYASFHLRPDSPKKRAAAADQGPNSATIGGEELSRFQRFAAWLPPARWTDLEAHERFSPHAKLFAAAMTMLAASLAMEFVLGIGFGP